MIRAVLDANVFVSAVLIPTGNPARLLALWRDGALTLVLSQPILDELARVLQYPKLVKRHGWSSEHIGEFVAELADFGVLVPTTLPLTVMTDDPDDNKYLECAVDGAVEYLVSGDEHLLKLREYRHVAILPPRLFLKELMRRRSAEQAE